MIKDGNNLCMRVYMMSQAWWDWELSGWL